MEKSEIGMYGCAKAEISAGVKENITFRTGGAALMVSSMLSDCQDMLKYGDISDVMIREDIHQALNRVKYIISAYPPGYSG